MMSVISTRLFMQTLSSHHHHLPLLLRFPTMSQSTHYCRYSNAFRNSLANTFRKHLFKTSITSQTAVARSSGGVFHSSLRQTVTQARNVVPQSAKAQASDAARIVGNVFSSLASKTTAGKTVTAGKATTAGKTVSTVGKVTAAVRNLTTQVGKAAGNSKPEVPDHAKKTVGKWLVGCAGMALGTVLLGGYSRLTESSLSMVQWHPIKDFILPRTDAEWQGKFALYKTTPEYKDKSKEKEITLSDFQKMYRIEWAHRAWTRAMAVVFFVPGVYLLSKGYVPWGLKPRLLMQAGTVGLQAWLGWKALQSGLREPGEYDVARMSPYTVSAHLFSTLALYAMFLWQGLSHLHVPQPLARSYIHRRTFMIWSHSLMAMTVFTAFTGAIVSSTGAGLVYNSWPKMADRWIPTDLWALGDSKWKNAFENTTTSQFIHRLLAHTTVFLVCAFWYVTRNAPLPPRARLARHCVLGAAVLQLSLGVATLLTLVHPHVAATHQGGSMLLLTTAIWLANELRRIPK